MADEKQMGIEEAKTDVVNAALAGTQTEALPPQDPAEAKKLARKAKNEASREALAEDQGEIERFLANADIGAIATNTDLRARFIISTSNRLGIPVVPGAILLLTTDGKVVVYYTAICASLIRNAKGWSSRKLEANVTAGVYEVWVRVWDPKDPEHYSDNVGAMPMQDGLGEPLAPSVRAENMKKAYTAAERRATLSLAGVGGGDARDDGAGPAWYPEQSLAETRELKVVQPQPRQVTAGGVPASATAPAPGEQPIDLPPASAAAPKRRVVKRKDGSVVPQPHAPGAGAAAAPAGPAPEGPRKAQEAGPGAAVSTQPTLEALEVVQEAPVAPEPQEEGVETPGEALGKEVCQHPGTELWLQTARKGMKIECPVCGEVLVAQGPAPATEAPKATEACTHPALKSGKPGHVYACPPPPAGCGQDVRIPGERQDPPKSTVATSPLPVRPKVRIVKRTTPS